MAADWPTISLRDAGVDLIDCEHKTPPAASTGYPYVAIPQLHQGRLLLKEARRISKEHLVEWTRRAKPQQHDVILSRRCNPGETAVVPEGVECAVGQNLVLLRANGRHVYPPFLRWLVRGPAWWDQISKFLNVGAVFDSLRCADVPRFELPIPPIDDQCAIAHILGTLDDKIELNRRTNETLEAMARALFKSWFVDFDPVRAKAAGKQPAGMDAATAALFPSEFVESEIGEIPEGWTASTVAKACDLNPFRTLPRGKAAPYVEMASLPTTGHRASEWPMREVGSGARFQNGDTLLARITPCLENGKTGYVDFLDDGAVGWGSTEYIVIRPKAPLPSEWGYLLAREPAFRDFATQKMEGTTGRQRVPATAVGTFAVAVPPPTICESFATHVAPSFRRMATACSESRTLSATRDALLPRLLSGDLLIPNAERFVEATT